MKSNATTISNPTSQIWNRLKSCGLLWLAVFGLAHGASAATVQIGSSTVQTGDAFSVPLTIDCGTNALGAFGFRIGFDPAVVRLTGFDGEGFFADRATAYASNPGQITFYVDQVGSLSYPTGLVTVARLDFVAVGSPSSSTALNFVTFDEGVWDTDGNGIPYEKVNGLVSILPSGIEQLVPCEGPLSGGFWKNHGQYVSAVIKVARLFLDEEFITEEEMNAIIMNAAESNCGSRRN
ncbi:MAG: cohesin domain-containing protein [Verrucomicrobiota bacterium]